EAVDLLAVRDVADDGVDVRAPGLEVALGRGERRFAPRADRDPGAAAGELPREEQPEPSGAAGDERDAAGEVDRAPRLQEAPAQDGAGRTQGGVPGPAPDRFRLRNLHALGSGKMHAGRLRRSTARASGGDALRGRPAGASYGRRREPGADGAGPVASTPVLAYRCHQIRG